MSAWAYLLAVSAFGLLIVVHELGHYLAARKVGIAVAEFAVGFGPVVVSRTVGDTTWSLRWIPLGGYVRWHEDGPDLFWDAPPGARAFALAAGPLANLALTALLLTFYFAGVQGWSLETPWLALKGTGYLFMGWWEGLTALLSGGGLAEIRSPVGMVEDTAKAMMGGHAAFGYGAWMSLNLGLMNLLPIPGLDGGRLCFVGLERLRRRPLDPVVEGWVHVSGFALLIALTLITAVKDLVA